MARPEITTRLRDGSLAILRDVGPEDGPALLRGFAELSQQSRVFRFLHHVERLSEAEVARLTSADGPRHEAVGAVVEVARDEVPAGIAHYFCARGVADRAELALTVIDRFQGRGLGTLLLGRLMRCAAMRGLAQFDALVHVRNDGMLHILRSLDATERMEEGIRIFRLPLYRDPARYPASRVGDAVRRAYALSLDAAAA